MKKHLLTLLFTLLAIQLKSQPYVIEKIGLESGLSSNNIMGITQDRKGFMWFSTESGLNRFDGKEFRVYKKNSDREGRTINRNELNTVYADRFEDIIWIATQREGLNAFDCKTESFKYYVSSPDNPDGIITNDITSVVNSKDGNLWVTTYYRGFEYFDKETEKFTHYNQATLPGLISDNIWTIAEDSKGRVYLGHVNNGLTLFHPQRNLIKNYRKEPDNPNSLPGNWVNAIFIDSNDHVWVGTDNGLAFFNSDTERFTVFRHEHLNDKSLISNYILSITQLKDGKLWIGTENGGVSILDISQQLFSSSKDVEFYNLLPGDDNYSLSNKTVRKIYQDTFDNVWIGTYGGGINFISSRESFFKTLSYSPIPSVKNKLSNRVAWGLCLDDDERLWVGTDGGGIDVFENGRELKLCNKYNSELSDNAVLSAFRDSQGNLWFGTFSGGVNVYLKEKEKIEHFPIEGVFDVRCFTEDGQGNIWIGSSSGINVCNSRREIIATYTETNSDLRENLIRTIFIDEEGCVWVGFFGSGLAIYNPDMTEQKSFDIAQGFPSNMVNHIYNDTKGNVWVGTSEGLVCFDRRKMTFDYVVLDETSGITDNHVRAIIEDNSGNLWISTTNGISNYLVEKGEFCNFNHYDGIPLGHFMSGSVAKDKSGTIYLGSQNGVCYFEPSLLLEEIELPPVVVTDFKIYDAGQEAPFKANHLTISPVMKLNYNQNTFEVSFNMLDYALNDLVEYAYMLKGMGDIWHNSQGQNSITFRDIPYGTYQFMVKSRVRNKEWSKEVTSFQIQIYPPLWLTWWAKMIYFFIVLVIIVSIVFFYKHKLELENSLILEKKNYQQGKELNDERLRFFTNITHELRTPLTLILGPLEDLNLDKTISEKHAIKISTIYKSATRLLNLVNQILEFRRTETQNKQLCVRKNDLVRLVKEVGLTYKELNAKKRIVFDTVIEDGDYRVYYDTEIVVTILENLISNALKYTESGSVILTLRNVEKENIRYVELEVKDTGRGIHPDYLPRIFDRYYQEKNSFQKSGTGIGLALVQNLVQLHQGEITVESTVDEGSSFQFRIKAENEYPDAIHEDSAELISSHEDVEKAEMKVEEKEKSDSKDIILIIEDNEDINGYITESLSENYKVYSALNGREGLEKAYKIIPDIVISDIVMPELDGLALTKALKDDIRTSHIPIILLTAKDTIQDKTEGYSIGADSYITKPFSSNLLASRIQNLLESRCKLAKKLQGNTDSKAEQITKSLHHLDKEFIEKVNQIIEDNIDSESFDVNLIAEKMCMSHSTLYRKIKALTEMSVSEFIRKVRIRKAERLLLTGKYTVSEISYMVGMNSVVYFRQCFKEEFGFTPTDYIKHIKSTK